MLSVTFVLLLCWIEFSKDYWLHFPLTTFQRSLNREMKSDFRDFSLIFHFICSRRLFSHICYPNTNGNHIMLSHFYSILFNFYPCKPGAMSLASAEPSTLELNDPKNNKRGIISKRKYFDCENAF